jgi:hypothetical protein
MGVLLGNSRRIMPDEFPRDGVRHACRFEQSGGRVTQRVKVDFILFARDVAAFAARLRDLLLGFRAREIHVVRNGKLSKK